jgi:hypothetical protein
MHGNTWTDLNHKPETISTAILTLVFARVRPELLNELSDSRPKMKYGNQYALTRYIPHPELSKHLLTIVNIARIADYNPTIFGQLVDKMLPIENPSVIKPVKRKENGFASEISEISDIVKKALQLTK